VEGRSPCRQTEDPEAAVDVGGAADVEEAAEAARRTGVLVRAEWMGKAEIVAPMETAARSR
jgi:hypothetical protein